MSQPGHRWRCNLSKVLTLTLALVASVALSACGSDDGDVTTADGGEITISYGVQPDYLDPGLAYSLEAWEALQQVYTPLLTYRHAEGQEGTELIPGLAEELPQVSGDGQTYTLRLRDGLKFSDGSEVMASDFEHTIKRVLDLQSGGAPFYQVIEGAEDYLAGDDSQADIPGIETDDRSGVITIKLNEPDGSFANVLAMPFAGLVPGDTEFKNLTEDPPPGVGAFMITESVPNRQFVLEKNPEFEQLKIPDLPTGSLDRINVQIIKSGPQQTQDVLNNELDYMQTSVPADLKPTVTEQAGDRYEEHLVPSTRYIYMNTREAPFNDPLVREAASYAIDKPALARLYAGELEPGCSLLPPGVPGYQEGFDTTECPYGDPSRPPDVERARELIEEAGAAGAEVTVWGENGDPGNKVAQAYADMLNEIGLDAEPRLLDGGVLYQALGNESTGAQTGPDSWFFDFPHPINFLFLVDGDAIQPRNNQNFSYVDDESVNSEIDRLLRETDLAAVTDEWAELNRNVAEPPQSYVAPYGHAKLTAFFSERMAADGAIFHPIFLNDYTSFALKESE